MAPVTECIESGLNRCRIIDDAIADRAKKLDVDDLADDVRTARHCRLWKTRRERHCDQRAEKASTVHGHALGLHILIQLLYVGEFEKTKASVHGLIGALAAVCAAYSLAAFTMRPKRHLVINAILYSTIVVLEIGHVKCHLR